MKLKEKYQINKAAKTGETICCPSCGTDFVKDNYQQAFCRTKGGTVCKDKYWNTVTPGKRNNTTRISPASAAWTAERQEQRELNWDPEDSMHPFDSHSLGQD